MKKFKGLLVELLYLLIIASLLDVYHFLNVPPVNDYLLVMAIKAMLVGLLFVFGPLIGKTLCTGFIAVVFYTLTKSIVNVYMLFAITTFIVFAFIYFKYVNSRLIIKLKYRLLLIVFFYISYAFDTAYKNTIDSEDDGFALNLTDSNYYDYYHVEEGEKFVNKFGRISYIERRLKLFIDEYINRSYYTNIISNYESRNEKINSNEYTSIFKDKNLLLIQTDSLRDCFVSKELTPNIYKLKNEGINLKGFNNQYVKYCSPSYEIMANLSLFPTNEEGCFNYLYDNNYYDEKLADIFNRNEYETYMYINDYDVFFNNTKMSRTFGYDNLILPYKIGFNGNQSNQIMLNDAIYHIANEKSFVYYVSMDLNELPSEDIATVTDTYPFAEDWEINMIVNLIDLDRAIGDVLTRLEENKLADDTVVMLYGIDYWPTQNIQLFAEKNNGEIDTALYIYCPGTKNETVFKKGSSLDLLPTIANLWGFDYNNKFIIGRDMFDDNYKGTQLGNNPGSYWYGEGFDKFDFLGGIKDSDEYYMEKENLRNRYRFSSLWFKYSKYYLDK